MVDRGMSQIVQQGTGGVYRREERVDKASEMF